ncbi:methionyl-tRNA formyltransferase [Robiginitalea sp.]|uniref:methionyl-tRNA formyltransferase n=1 Tax=Robiginitalea sp. TaxID=1902411 RepID=UPI003C728CEE
MKKTLRIAFMGTPEFAVPCLQLLLDHKYPVVLVVTAPDRPAGRGRKVQSSAVKQCAEKNGIPIIQPERLKDPEFIDQLREFQINLQIVVAFRMLPEAVWALPEFGTFNLHASLLPDYRGAAPIHWAVINGEVETGVTTFFIDEQIDTGRIILQDKTPVGPEETTGSLYLRLMDMGAKLVVETVRQIASGQVVTRTQKHLQTPKKAPKLTADNTRLNWEDSQKDLYNKIRGLSPHPGAWSYFENGGDAERVKIFRSQRESNSTSASAGSLLQIGKRLLVRTSDGWLEVLEMQLPGKRRMFVQDILNGLEIQKSARFL